MTVPNISDCVSIFSVFTTQAVFFFLGGRTDSELTGVLDTHFTHNAGAVDTQADDVMS